MQARLRAWAGRRSSRFAETAPVPLDVPIRDLLAMDAHAFDLELLQADPLYPRLSPGEARLAIATAVADGRQRARRWAPCDPGAIAASLGVPVVVAETGNRFGTVFQFAEYRSRPPGITIYRAAMDLLRGLICQHELAPALGLDDPEPVYLAHEIYHHLDGFAPIARALQVTTLALGPVRLRSGLVSLKEIGASAFAADVTGLQCHPRMLDLLARRALTGGLSPNRT